METRINPGKLSVSFYLLAPQSKTQSALYVSISRRRDRMRFATGEALYTKYCNIRSKGGRRMAGKELLKRNSEMYLTYKSKLEGIETSLLIIGDELRRKGDYTLSGIRAEYERREGLVKQPKQTFEAIWMEFLAENRAKWSNATQQHFNAVLAHLRAFAGDNLSMGMFTRAFWNELRDRYFVGQQQMANSSINKNLSKLKQFLLFAQRTPDKINPYLPNGIDLAEFDYLSEDVEPFKIALKMPEVENLINIDLAADPRLDRVRDAFLTLILTAQRFSDLPAVLNPENMGENSITIYQQKTGARVTIPLHPQLKAHLSRIYAKYSNGLPEISNQKFNDYCKELCERVVAKRRHTWVTQSGNNKVERSAWRHELCGSHTGRRTYCTLALAAGIPAEVVMKVSGHTDYKQFSSYVKVDDQDIIKDFEKFMLKPIAA